MGESAPYLDSRPSQFPSTVGELQGEQAILDCLEKTAQGLGGPEYGVNVMNLYVALKSKPMAILYGPADGGKDNAVRSVARLLAGDDPLCYQRMVAHARWASGNRNVALFTAAQTRLNSSKLLALIEEALQPENAPYIYMAHLQGLTPAELMGFFTDLAPQIVDGWLTRLPCLDLAAPRPYPTNLLLTGTMDAASFNWYDPNLLSQATVILWSSGPSSSSTLHPEHRQTGAGRRFLASRVRSRQAACRKLLRLPTSVSSAMRTLHQIELALARHGVALPASAVDDVLIYLANAWTDEGTGVFDRDPEGNLQTALDLAVSQNVLPHALAELRALPRLSRQLSRLFQPELPRASTLLTSLC